MKKIFLFLLLLSSAFSLFAITFYSSTSVAYAQATTGNYNIVQDSFGQQQCQLDPAGPYDSLDACYIKLFEGKKYKLVQYSYGAWVCYEDPSGTYTWKDCQDARSALSSPTPQLTYAPQQVNTAIGPIDTNPTGFVKSIFSLLLGISGGIALILIIISGYRLMASRGNPEQVQGAREMLTSAIVGLLFIILSFVILQIIGVNILHIPGFGA